MPECARPILDMEENGDGVGETLPRLGGFNPGGVGITLHHLLMKLILDRSHPCDTHPIPEGGDGEAGSQEQSE